MARYRDKAARGILKPPPIVPTRETTGVRHVLWEGIYMLAGGRISCRCLRRRIV